VGVNTGLDMDMSVGKGKGMGKDTDMGILEEQVKVEVGFRNAIVSDF